MGNHDTKPATREPPLDAGPGGPRPGTGPPGDSRGQRRARSLRSALGWLVAAVLLPLVAAGGAFLVHEWTQERLAAIARLRDESRVVRQAIDRELALDRAVLNALATSRDIDAGDWRAFDDAARQAALARPGSWVVLYDEAGQAVVNTSLPFGTPLPNFRTLLAQRTHAEWQGRTLPLPGEFLFTPFRTGRPSYSGLFYGVFYKKPVVASTVPVVRGGRPRYALALAYGFDFYVGLLQTEHKMADGVIALFDGAGLFIARSVAPEQFVARRGPAPFGNGTRDLPMDGAGEGVSLDDERMVFAYSRSAASDWVAAVAMRRSALLAPAWRALWLWLGILGAAALMGAFFAFRLWQRVGLPLAALAQEARSATDPHAGVAYTGIEEVEALRAALRERARAESEVRSFAQFPKENPNPVVRAATDGRVLFFNDGARRLLQALGWTDGASLPEPLLHEVQRVPPRGTIDGFEFTTPDERVWSFTISASAGEGHFNLFGRDTTDQKRAEDAVRRSEERLRLALDAAKFGTFDLDIPTGHLVWDLPKMRMWGISDPRDFRYPAVLDQIHPEDRAHVAAAVEASFETGEYASEYRVTWPDGSVHWLYARARVEFDDGRPVRMLGVELDITDRKVAEQALAKANERLREADRRKDEFLGMLSHELRNPLAPIRSSVYVLRHADATSAQADHARIVIERQSEHLTRIVDDLLDVTRIARGKILLHRDRVELRDLVARAAEDVHHSAHDRGVSLRVALTESRLWADADATRITQVLGNLLNNAIKFTPRGGEIAVTLREVDATGEISVRDTGAGIDPELLPTMFDAFVQGKRTLARTEGGVGLGLALVKGLVELHGGSVEAHSEGVGKGAEFIVRLPLIGPLVTEHTSREAPTRATTTRRVLVVDDNADAAESLAELVALFGHHVEVAYDGPSAIEKVRARRPDVVLCDIGLPGMDGYEVARALRAEHDGAVRLVAVSGYAQADDVDRATEAGFDAHLAKPADPAALERLLS